MQNPNKAPKYKNPGCAVRGFYISMYNFTRKTL